MKRFKTFLVISSLFGGGFFQTLSTSCFADTTDIPDASFISSGMDTFNPWTTIEYCAKAKKIADDKVEAICAPDVSVRQGEFTEKFLAAGHGMQCEASAPYSCQK